MHLVVHGNNSAPYRDVKCTSITTVARTKILRARVPLPPALSRSLCFFARGVASEQERGSSHQQSSKRRSFKSTVIAVAQFQQRISCRRQHTRPHPAARGAAQAALGEQAIDSANQLATRFQLAGSSQIPFPGSTTIRQRKPTLPNLPLNTLVSSFLIETKNLPIPLVLRARTISRAACLDDNGLSFSMAVAPVAAPYRVVPAPVEWTPCWRAGSLVSVHLEHSSSTLLLAIGDA